jgi:hypothetical protein
MVMIGPLSVCIALASRQTLTLPKIEDVLIGANETDPDAAARWNEIGTFLKHRIETVNPPNIDELQSMLAKDKLQSNSSASFQVSVMPIRDRHQGYVVWMNITSRRKPKLFSRQATFLLLWEGRQVVANMLGGQPLLRDGYLTEGFAVRAGKNIFLAGTNPMISGEGGYGPSIAVVLNQKPKKWIVAASSQMGSSGRIEAISPNGQMTFSIFTNHSSVLRSPFQIPTFTESQVVRFTGKAFKVLHREPVRNRYWIVSEVINALQRGDRATALHLVESPKVVDIAINAGVGTKDIVWETTVEKRGDDQGIQINAKPGGVWHSISFWFKGSTSKLIDATKNRPQ